MPKTNRIRSVQEACLLLGVYPDAPVETIRKAYRKKAFEFHPDRNSSTDAHEKFLLLTEAYEFLTDPNLRTNRPSSNKHSNHQTSDPHHHKQEAFKRGHRTYTREEFEEKLRWAREVAKKKAKIHLIHFEEVKQTLLYKIFRFTSLLYILIGLTCTIDFFLTTEEIRYVAEFDDPDSEYVYIYLHDDAGSTKLMSFDLPFWLDRGDQIIVKRTLLLDQIKSYRVRKDGIEANHAYPNFLQIHLVMVFIFVVMMLPLANFVTHGPRPAFYFFLKLNFWLPLFTLAGMLIVIFLNR